MKRDAEVPGVVPPQSGPVAQLGARFHGMEEVVGSIPTRSTILSITTTSLCSPTEKPNLRGRHPGRVSQLTSQRKPVENRSTNVCPY